MKLNQEEIIRLGTKKKPINGREKILAVLHDCKKHGIDYLTISELARKGSISLGGSISNNVYRLEREGLIMVRKCRCGRGTLISLKAKK